MSKNGMFLKKDINELSQFLKCRFIVKALVLTLSGLLLFNSLSFSAILIPSMGQMQKTSASLGYQDTLHAFKIEYPTDWEKLQFSQGITEGPHKLVVNFLSPLRGPSETFRQYFLIETANVTSTSTFSKQELSFLAHSFPHFTPVQIRSNSSLAGHNAYAVVFTYSDPIVGTAKAMEIWAINGSKAYILSYHADSSDYTRYLPTIETMIKSFELIPK
ncbi:MAG: hypothetical protein WA323_20415 [Candidatus Nitrosopolaris sp.]